MQQTTITKRGTKTTAIQVSGPAGGSGTTPKAESRACPTRATGPVPLFQHQVTVSQCQSKQRGLYHKCFTCAHANGRA